MKIRHIRSIDVWLMSKGNRVLYRGRENPWHSAAVMQAAIRRSRHTPSQVTVAQVAA